MFSMLPLSFSIIAIFLFHQTIFFFCHLKIILHQNINNILYFNINNVLYFNLKKMCYYRNLNNLVKEYIWSDVPPGSHMYNVISKCSTSEKIMQWSFRNRCLLFNNTHKMYAYRVTAWYHWHLVIIRVTCMSALWSHKKIT